MFAKYEVLKNTSGAGLVHSCDLPHNKQSSNKIVHVQIYMTRLRRLVSCNSNARLKIFPILLLCYQIGRDTFLKRTMKGSVCLQLLKEIIHKSAEANRLENTLPDQI